MPSSEGSSALDLSPQSKACLASVCRAPLSNMLVSVSLGLLILAISTL